jgi:hypothetical protein
MISSAIALVILFRLMSTGWSPVGELLREHRVFRAVFGLI